MSSQDWTAARVLGQGGFLARLSNSSISRPVTAALVQASSCLCSCFTCAQITNTGSYNSDSRCANFEIYKVRQLLMAHHGDVGRALHLQQHPHMQAR
jgi:hypothetical protein